MTTRTALELWERLVEEAGEELIERAASVSVAQAEKELRDAGFDVAAERAEGEAFLADLERPAEVERPKEKPVSQTRARAVRPERRRPSGVVVIAAVTAAAAAAGGLIYAATHEHSEPQQPAPPAPPTSTANPTSTAVEDLVAAAKARRDEAFSACTQGLYSRCADLLDQARQLDPAGESDPRVVQARAAIAASRHPAPEPKSPAPRPNPEEKPPK
jgi:hypothetical protein